jgi:hypothetical protein
VAVAVVPHPTRSRAATIGLQAVWAAGRSCRQNKQVEIPSVPTRPCRTAGAARTARPTRHTGGQMQWQWGLCLRSACAFFKSAINGQRLRPILLDPQTNPKGMLQSSRALF